MNLIGKTMRQSFLMPWLCLGIIPSMQVFAAAAECKWNTWPQVAETALSAAPEFGPLEKRKEWAGRRADAATLGPVSKVAAQYLNGTSPANSGEAEVSYEWTIENSEKKSARIKAARSELSYTAAEIEERKAAIILDLAILSERFHQISHEKDVLNETLTTYRTLLKQFSAFPVLSPEQNVTVAIFKLARDETQLKLGQLKVELENYGSVIRQLTGCSQLSLPSDVRKERRSWPKISSAEDWKKSASLKRIEAKKQIARENLEVELRQTTADYSVGPIARWNRDEADQNVSFGVAFSMPLVQQQRKVLSSAAAASYEVSEAEAQLDIRKVSSDLEKWTTQYRNSVEILSEGYAEADVLGKHATMEKAFLAGRVNASLVIEAHRQMFEHMVSRHHIEMKASEALWNIRFLTGTLSKDEL